MEDLAVRQPGTPVASEATALAREFVRSHRKYVEWLRTNYKLPPHEALARSEAGCDAEFWTNLEQRPSDQLQWYDLHQLASRDHERAVERWETIKQDASDELRCGHRTATAVEGVDHSPWARARFLAIREELSREWQPRSGIENVLIDMMAMALATCLRWQESLAVRQTFEAMKDERSVRDRNKYELPLLLESQAIEQAAAMVDRFNRIFLRSLRALRDLRRYTSAIVVQNAGQVNVGGQQVNVTTQEPRGPVLRDEGDNG